MIGSLYTPAEIAEAFPLDTANKKAAKKAAGTKRSPQGEPPFVGILRTLGMTVAPAKDLEDGTGFRTTCPWSSEHTDAVNDHSGFLTFWPDGEPRHWLCRHSHCAHRTIGDVLALAFPAQAKRPDRPIILVCPPETLVASAAREALAAVPGVYARRGRLVHVYRHAGQDGKRIIPSGAVGIRDAGPAWTREQLSKAANFERTTTTKAGISRVPSMTPEWLPSMILEAPGPGFPELRAVATVPVILADGTIHAEPDTLKHGVLYLGPPDFSPIPEHPTENDAEAAWGRFQLLLSDFPFATNPNPDAHRAACLAALLTMTGRYAFPGPAPFVLIEANSQASGKGLLSQVLCTIAIGQGAPVMSCPREEVELKKGILPVLMDGTRAQILDEVHPGFGGRAWNAMVTATSYRDRLLGASSLVELPNDCVWICTGNNVGLAPDTTRRCLPIRLEPMDEHPEDRTGFQFPDLLSHVRTHQAELLRDALTIFRAFHLAGRPASGLKPWGSFEGWSALVRDAVYWCTKVDPDCRQALASVADMGRLIHKDLITELHEAFGSSPFTTGSVIVKASTKPSLQTALEAACPSKDGRLKAVSIGKRFASFRRRPVSGLILDQAPTDDRRGGALWMVRTLDAVPLHPIAEEAWGAIR